MKNTPVTDEERLFDMIAFGDRMREKVKSLIDDIEAQPISSITASETAVMTWRSVLLTMVWDISDALLSLAKTGANHFRTMRILNRSLFEYCVRLEYYVSKREDAEKHWRNQEAWFALPAKVGIAESDLKSWSKEERRAYNEMIRVDGGFERADLKHMVREVFRSRGYRGAEYRKAVRYMLSNYYYIASSYVHGSQGVFYDVLEQRETQPQGLPKGIRQADLRLKSFRLNALQLTRESVFLIILAIYAEARHRKTSLPTDFYWRELDLISGNW